MECILCKKNIKEIDFRDLQLLKHYVSGMGKIRGRKKTGLCATHQRKITQGVKRARHMGLLSPSGK